MRSVALSCGCSATIRSQLLCRAGCCWTVAAIAVGRWPSNPERLNPGGLAVRDASQLVQQITGCDRVYAIAFGEGASHLHLHLIPRFADDPATSAWLVADHYRAVQAGQREAAPATQVKELVELARRIC